jgi:ribosome-binding factor A
MLHSRIKRVEELILQETARIINYDLRDPRLQFASVTHVKVATDLTESVIFVSQLGDDEDGPKNLLAALESASGHIRHLLSQRLELRRLPQLHFEYDDTQKQASRIFKILNEIQKEEPIVDVESSPNDEDGEPEA